MCRFGIIQRLFGLIIKDKGADLHERVYIQRSP